MAKITAGLPEGGEDPAMQMAYGNGESGDGDWGTLSMITLGMCNDTG